MPSIKSIAIGMVLGALGVAFFKNVPVVKDHVGKYL